MFKFSSFYFPPNTMLDGTLLLIKKSCILKSTLFVLTIQLDFNTFPMFHIVSDPRENAVERKNESFMYVLKLKLVPYKVFHTSKNVYVSIERKVRLVNLLAHQKFINFHLFCRKSIEICTHVGLEIFSLLHSNQKCCNFSRHLKQVICS